MRTRVAPSSIATSKSSVMPIDRCVQGSDGILPRELVAQPPQLTKHGPGRLGLVRRSAPSSSGLRYAARAAPRSLRPPPAVSAGAKPALLCLARHVHFEQDGQHLARRGTARLSRPASLTVSTECTMAAHGKHVRRLAALQVADHVPLDRGPQRAAGVARQQLARPPRPSARPPRPGSRRRCAARPGTPRPPSPPAASC